MFSAIHLCRGGLRLYNCLIKAGTQILITLIGWKHTACLSMNSYLKVILTKSETADLEYA